MSDRISDARISDALRDKLSKRLSFYDDIGIRQFFRDRFSPPSGDSALMRAATMDPGSSTPDRDSRADSTAPLRSETSSASTDNREEPLPKSRPKPIVPQNPTFGIRAASNDTVLRITPKVSLFDSIEKIVGDSLLKIRNDLGECTRCKLHTTRNKIVFGDGSEKADLIFVGEGPGRDEDAQGLPFVGRAGKLLTQMIEAMGLQRKDVYIANVVKCRPPENRLPEPDEIKTCSPYLLRQLDTIAPKVIVCLGACSAQTLLQTNRGISHFRGQWMDFRGTKLMATYHPAYLLRNPAAKADVWKDLQKVMAVLGLEVKKGAAAGAGKPA
jgi:uracil-DNA glycosylase